MKGGVTVADDINLTVRVRDMTRGDFNRLDRQMDRMRRDLRGISRDTESAGMHSRRLGQDIQGLSARFQNMQRTGSMTRRELTNLRTTLDGMSRSALHAAHSGEITQEKYHALSAEINGLNDAFRQLDVNMNSVNGGMNDVSNSGNTLNGSLNSVNSTLQRTSSDGQFAGSMFSNMRGKLLSVGAVLGSTLLPTVGALAPMLAGLGAVAGVAALAFSGLDKPTKFLSKSQKDFLTALKPVTKEFGNLRKSAQDAVLPQLTKSFGDVKNMVEDLNPVVKIAGDTFGSLVGKIARGVSSKDFMGPFTENVRMGTKWLSEFSGSFGTFARSFFEFGTKSQPALDAWQNMLGGFLDRGLPSMFDGLEQGIKGASDWLNGLAYFINDGLLPALGKISGSFMEAFGPLFGEIMVSAGASLDSFATVFENVMEGLEPVLKVAADAFQAFNEVATMGVEVFGDLAAVLGEALLGTFADLLGIEDPFANMDEGFRGFSAWVEGHRGAIREAFTQIGQAIITMVQTGVTMLPLLVSSFAFLTRMVINALDGIVSGAAMAFGWVPGIGDDLKNANAKFDEWATGTLESLNTVENGAENLSTALNSNLTRASLKFDVTEAKRNLEEIKTQLNDPALTDERKARLTIEKERAEKQLAEAQRKLAAFDKKKASAKLSAQDRASAIIAKVNRMLSNLNGRTATTWTYHNVKTSYVSDIVKGSGSLHDAVANGNIFRGKRYADGGVEDHQAQIAPAGAMRVWAEPETGGEAYIPLSRAKRGRSRRIAAETVNMLGGSVQWFAKGGLTKAQKAAKKQADSEKEARSNARSDLTLSFFGKIAGFKKDEFIHALGLPESLGALVGDLNKWRGLIKKATHGATESRLLKALTTSGKSLIKYEKQLTTTNKALEKAKDKLSDLKQAAASLKDSVKQGIISELNITRSAGAEDSQVTINTIMSQLTADASRAGSFESSLATLKEKGVSGRVLEQISQAGVEGGGLETAQALLGASKEQIKKINDLNQSIRQSADDAGDIASDTLYQAGIKAAEGLVKGLTAKKKSIEKAMLNIAKSMEKAIKKALGIKSPSKVMEKVGHFTAEGFSVGMKQNRHPARSWESMLNVPSSAGSSGSGMSTSGQPMVVRIYLGDKDIGEVIIDPLRKAISHRGGNVQRTLGS